MKPHKGRQRKTWVKLLIGDPFVALGLDKVECMKGVERGIWNAWDYKLCRHRGREGKVSCSFCGIECENVVRVL